MPALAADFRRQFGLSIFEMGETYSVVEAMYLMISLLKDPGTELCAAKNGWDYPESRELQLLKDTWDLHSAINTAKGKKPIRYPRAFKLAVDNAKKLTKGVLPLNTARKVLEFMNPNKTQKSIEPPKRKLTLDKDY